MLKTSKKILLIGASLVALAGSAPAMAASAEKVRSPVSEQAQQQVNINSASAVDIANALKGIGLRRLRRLWLIGKPMVHLRVSSPLPWSKGLVARR